MLTSEEAIGRQVGMTGGFEADWKTQKWPESDWSPILATGHFARPEARFESISKRPVASSLRSVAIAVLC